MSDMHISFADAATSRRALVVEDESLIAMYLADLLQETGFEVATTVTAAETLELVRHHDSFSVAFIDLDLPDSTGLELISHLKKIDPALPIVIASGYGAMARRDHTGDATQSLVLAKPYERKDVFKLLKTLGFHLPS